MTAIFSGAWQHRRSNLYNRILENANDTTTNPGYLFSDPGTISGGFTADTTAIVRQEAAQAAGAIDAWMWDWYHDENLITDPTADYAADATLHPNAIQVSKLDRGLNAYVAATDITAPKFWTMILADDLGLAFPNNTYKYVNSFCAHIDSLMSDPRWLRTKSGGYFLGFFNASTIDSTHYNQCLAQFTHSPLYIVFDGGSSSGSPLTHNTAFWYGVQNLPSGAGQHAYVDLEAQDKAKWTGSNAGTMNWLTDRRPFTPGTIWVDQPTQVEALRHITDAINSSAGITFGVYTIWNELSEEGPGALQTAQEGTRYTDALKWARVPSSKPLSYTYELTLNSLAMGSSGTWTVLQPDPTGVLGAHDSDELSSANTGDFKSVTHQAMTKCGLFAHTGPDLGILTANVDGVDIADVDLYTPTNLVHQLVWTSSTLTNASHTCKWTVKGTKNASSSAVTIKLDSAQITYHP